MNYKKELLKEMRLLSKPNVYPNTYVEDELITRAVTINENMKAYGYCLTPDDVYWLASIGCPWMHSFYRDFISLMDDVKAEPMYPDFPNQVMNMDEAQFRMHQLIHYFSTYGVETMFNINVSRGWLPDVESTEKTEADATLLNAKVVELITSDQIYIIPAVRILTKKERMTLPEMDILSEALSQTDWLVIKKINIPFKENLVMVFNKIANDFKPDDALSILRGICQHSGDVWRCLGGYLSEHGYKLSTSQKKLMVKVLESFPIADFEANLYLSATKGADIIRKLEFLSFNRFSRSPEHKEAVRKLRNNELQSWNGRVEWLLTHDKMKALDYIADRPGMLVRMMARLIRLDIDSDEISKRLNQQARSLSMQTLITLLNYFSTPSISEERMDATALFTIVYRALRCKMTTLDTPLRNKRIYISEGMYSFANSYVDMAKTSEGGYVRSGIAYKIPEEANVVRFFVYWNDDKRIDIDLHGWSLRDGYEPVHIGWNCDRYRDGMVHSGDITHSDAAEYIDVDLNETTADSVTLSIHSYTDVPFNAIEECFTGMLAVKELRENVKLYNPQNCFFSHNLRSNTKSILYGKVDTKKRVLVLHGKENNKRQYFGYIDKTVIESPAFTLENYLRTLIMAQGSEIVDNKDDADVVLVLDKPIADNEISIIDSDFFCD